MFCRSSSSALGLIGADIIIGEFKRYPPRVSVNGVSKFSFVSIKSLFRSWVGDSLSVAKRSSSAFGKGHGARGDLNQARTGARTRFKSNEDGRGVGVERRTKAHFGREDPFVAFGLAATDCFRREE